MTDDKKFTVACNWFDKGPVTYEGKSSDQLFDRATILMDEELNREPDYARPVKRPWWKFWT